jgi:hypothetical protein
VKERRIFAHGKLHRSHFLPKARQIFIARWASPSGTLHRDLATDLLQYLRSYGVWIAITEPQAISGLLSKRVLLRPTIILAAAVASLLSQL